MSSFSIAKKWMISNAENSSYRKLIRVSVKPGNAIILHRSTVERVARVRVLKWQIAPSTAVGPLGQLGQRALRPAVSRWKPAGGPARIRLLHSAGAFASGTITMISCASISRPVLHPLKPPRRLRTVNGQLGVPGTRVRGSATAVSTSTTLIIMIISQTAIKEYLKNIWRIFSIAFAILDACAIWDNMKMIFHTFLNNFIKLIVLQEYVLEREPVTAHRRRRAASSVQDAIFR